MPTTTTSTEAAGMTPRDYLLRVLNDPSADEARRDRAAIALLPYTVPKPAPLGAKDKQQAMAETAEAGTDWESLLNPSELYAPRRVKPYGGGSG